MTCACIGNKDDTAILTPCLLHAQWAKGYAVAQLGRVSAAEQGWHPTRLPAGKAGEQDYVCPARCGIVASEEHPIMAHLRAHPECVAKATAAEARPA